MKTKSCLLFLLLLPMNNITAQTLQQFYELADKKDTIGELALLKKWEEKTLDDPDLYIAWFNYYFQMSMKEVVRVDSNPKGDFKIFDPETNKQVGSMYGEIFYDPEIVKNGIEYINKGIEKYPNRLDMRLGKVYSYGKTLEYEKFTDEIIKAIDYSAINKNKWTWSANDSLENPADFLLHAIQDYQVQLYNTQDDSLLDNMLLIADEVLKFYPDHVQSLSNKSIVYILKNEYDKGIESLLMAEKLAPTDYIVYINLAQAYKLKGDIDKAIKYYELVIKYGDQDSKDFANEQIKELKKRE